MLPSQVSLNPDVIERGVWGEFWSLLGSLQLKNQLFADDNILYFHFLLYIQQVSELQENYKIIRRFII